MKLYKVLGDNGACIYAKGKSWPLPTDQPTKYLEIDGDISTDLKLCKNGLHFATQKSLLTWLDQAVIICEAEALIEDEKKDFILEGDKAIATKARLTKQLNWSPIIGTHFAKSCYSHMLDTLAAQNRIELDTASMLTELGDKSLIFESHDDLLKQSNKIWPDRQIRAYFMASLYASQNAMYSAAVASLIGAYCQGLPWQEVSTGMWEHRDWQSRKLFQILES